MFKMRKNSLDKSSNKGMTTIEACVIIPISFSLIFLIFFLGIYFYNKNAYDQCIARALVSCVQYDEKDNDELEEEIENKLNSLLNQSLILKSDIDTDISVEYGYTSITLKGSFDIPNFIYFGGLDAGDNWEISSYYSCPRLRSSQFVRMISGLTNN